MFNELIGQCGPGSYCNAAIGLARRIHHGFTGRSGIANTRNSLPKSRRLLHEHYVRNGDSRAWEWVGAAEFTQSLHKHYIKCARTR